jgi:hypothetical protein
MSPMDFIETPIQAIKNAIALFEFSCFVNDAVNANRITPNTFSQQIQLQDDGKGLVLNRGFTDAQLEAYARNLVLMAFASTALATDKAMDIVFGNKNPDDISGIGSARAILYQIRCAFAHDPLVPIWNTKGKYKNIYRVTVNVPRESGTMTPRTIEFYPLSLAGKHLKFADFGNLGGYLALLLYCLDKVQSDPKGNMPYPPPVED